MKHNLRLYDYIIKITSGMLYGNGLIFDPAYDTEEFWDLAKEHKLESSILHYQQKQFRFESSHVKWNEDNYKQYIKDVIEVGEGLKADGITPVFVKGIFLSKTIYGDWYYRNLGDIDILVDEANFDKTFYAMCDMGYRKVEDINNNTPRLILGKNFHEIKMYKKDSIVEVKRGVAAIDTDFHQWLLQKRIMVLNNTCLYTLDIYHTALLLFAQAFINNEGKVVFYKCRLREYFDVAYLIVNCHELNWDKLKKLSDHYELTHEVYSVIKSVDEIYHLPDEFMNNIFPKFGPMYWPYKKTFFYYNEDKDMEFNEGLLFQEFRADAKYSIFDKDFAVYQYIKNYKAVLYSKKNSEYRNRIKILEGNEIVWRDYKFGNSCANMRYAFILQPECFKVIAQIEADKLYMHEEMNISVRTAWYDNDITSCILQRHVDSGVICKNEEQSSKEINVSVSTRNYYSEGSEYSKKIDLLNRVDKVVLKTSANDKKVNVEFIFSKELLFKELDVVAFEIKLIDNYTNDFVMSIGADVDVVEIVG